jgi:AraC-like DNA-binding protein
MNKAMEQTSSDAFAARFSTGQLAPFSTYRADLGRLSTNIASVYGAPPGYYEHPPYDGVAVYMAMSRNVGRVDVGDGAFEMKAQARDFIVGVPGSSGKMESLRGGHGMQVVIAPQALNAASAASGNVGGDFRRLHSSFYSDKCICNLLTRLGNINLSKNEADPLWIDSLILELVDALERFSDTVDRRAREAAALNAGEVSNIVDYMQAHLGEAITLHQLADVVGLPLTRFLKAFRNCVGETPYQHLMRLRLEAARLALMADTSTIADVAFACGFSSQQHLTGLFSERFGISPAAFRKQTQRGEIMERRCTVMA